MTSAERLEEKRKETGKTKCYLAKKLGVSRPCYYKLAEHPERCTFFQARVLIDELMITSQVDQDAIFLP